MAWMEIIRVNMAEDNRALLEDKLREFVSNPAQNKKNRDIRIYRNAEVENSLSIHLYWNTGRPLLQGSQTGLRLTHVLRETGLISHSVWIEEI
jgi:hypothetical protein